jgi:hypothetical protein
LRSFGIFFSVFVRFAKKNLATLVSGTDEGNTLPEKREGLLKGAAKANTDVIIISRTFGHMHVVIMNSVRDTKEIATLKTQVHFQKRCSYTE